jgi:AbrB family looped-hinge helix DNA binding protein
MSIPPEIVEALGLEEGSQIEIELRNNEVVLRAVRNKDGR